MYIMSKREAIVEAAKILLWEKGYEATSPRDIQNYCHAGQGSFYHHFRSKKALAELAIKETVRDRIAVFEEVMHRPLPVLERIRLYLDERTHVLKGCRVGRMVWDSAVSDEDLRRPLEQYFAYIERRLTEELEKAQRAGELKLTVRAQSIARVVIAVMQGGYTLSRAFNAEERFSETIDALWTFLQRVTEPPMR